MREEHDAMRLGDRHNLITGQPLSMLKGKPPLTWAGEARWGRGEGAGEGRHQGLLPVPLPGAGDHGGPGP